jgi:signal transduction histidine kinase
MRHGMELGADDYLPKPFSIEDLYTTVETRLKKAQAVRQAAEKKLADLRDNIGLMLPHEMRTPLNGILAYGELLAAEATSLPAPEVAEMGQVIYDSARRLERSIENLLVYAQIELLDSDPQKLRALRTERTESPAEVIIEHARARAQEARRSGDLVIEVADYCMPISKGYLAKIVDELSQNAFKFSPSGSAVRLSLSELDDAVVLAVTDQGHGFSPGQISKVGAYMQFDRTQHEQQGLGLGLVIAKRLTELHGGTLSIQSQHGTGTTVSVRLPKPARAED